MRARQRRARRRLGEPGELMSRWWEARRDAADDLPPRYYLERDFFAPRLPLLQWEEADLVRWCFMETGMTYDAADAEVRAVTTLLTPQQAPQDPSVAPAFCGPSEAAAAASGPASTALPAPDEDQAHRAATRRPTWDEWTTRRPSRAA